MNPANVSFSQQSPTEVAKGFGRLTFAQFYNGDQEGSLGNGFGNVAKGSLLFLGGDLTLWMVFFLR